MSTKSDNQSKGKPLPQFVLRPKETNSSVTALCFMRNNEKDFLICGTDCGQLLLWSLMTYRCESILNNNNNSRIIHLISFDNQFICQYKSGLIDVFDDQLLVKKSYNMSNASYCKCFLYSEIMTNNSINTKTKQKFLGFVSQTNNSIIEIIDFNNDKTVANVGITDNKYGWAMTLFISPFDVTNSDIVLVLIGYENGFLTLFKTNTELNESQLMTELKCFDSLITCMDFNYQFNCGICCSVTDIISVWNLNISEDKSRVSLTLKRDLKITNSGVLCCAIRSDGRVFSCGGSDSRIRVFAFKSLKALAVIDTHNEPIECVIYSHKLISKQMQYLLAAASRDKTISVWSIYN
jgi:WD40 repeat protein